MTLWFNLKINSELIGHVEIRRVQPLDLSDPAAIQDVVSTYDVYRDGHRQGTVEHRYGDQAWRLLALAADLIARQDAGAVEDSCDLSGLSPAGVCRCTKRRGCVKSAPPIGTNAGHGHVWPRPDGVKARCGGPGLCTGAARPSTSEGGVDRG